MPWYVADYLADTAHLRAAQSGAYMHLIMHYWQHGGLPSDNAQLAAIARMSDPEWRKVRPVLEPFFQSGWKHKRIDEELEKAKAKYELRAAAGKRGGDAKANGKQNPSNATANGYQPQPPPQSQPQEVGDGGEARGRSLISEEAFTVAGDLLEAMGLPRDHPLSVGAPMTVQSWLNGGWPADIIKVGVQKAMQNRKQDPPNTLKYFEKAIARTHAEMSRPLPIVEIREAETIKVTSNGKPKSSIIQAADDLRRKLASFDGPARGVEQLRSGEGETSPRLLSNG